MTIENSKPSRTAVSRLKERLLQRWTSREQVLKEAKPQLPALAPRRALGFPSRIAEFLLVFRLRAQRRSALSADILERAVRVVLVTCQHWFAGLDKHQPRKRD